MGVWRDLIGTVNTVLKIGLNKASLDAGALTAPRNYFLPDTSGTLALTSQLGDGGSITVSDTAPVAPTAGQQWYDTNTSILYTRIVDADSAQWVETGRSLSAVGAFVKGYAVLNFGATGEDIAFVTVLTPTLAAGQQITVALSPLGTADNDADEHFVEQAYPKVSARADGVSFTVSMASTDHTRLFGTWLVDWAIN
jgi:hypothetical protein